MNKTFAAGLIAAAAYATEAIDATSLKTQSLNAPRVILTGPYYAQRPYYREKAPAYPKKERDHVSTDDDRYSSSDSDSVSSSDEERQ